MRKTILSVKKTVDLINHLCCNLELLHAKYSYTGVVGIERGGIHISKWIAKHLGIRHQSVRISCYDENDKLRENPIVSINDKFDPPFVLVDDIVDIGNTLQAFIEFTKFTQGIDKDFIMAALHWVKESKIKPDLCAGIKESDHWIIYPWERPIEFNDVIDLYY